MAPRSTLVPPSCPGAVRYARRLAAPALAAPKLLGDDDWALALPRVQTRGAKR